MPNQLRPREAIRLTVPISILSLILAASPVVVAATGRPRLDPRVVRRFETLDRATRWRSVATIPLAFPAFHPQGMVRIGDAFYLSSVKVRVEPRRNDDPRDPHDRTAGAGVGHLFKIAPDGRLLADLILGEGTIYHPGGIDFDGRVLWVPVSEYRPASRSIVYRVDPRTMTAAAAMRVADHVGAVAYDAASDRLVGANWGSRRFYRWRPARTGPVADAPTTPSLANPERYVDYQDCHGAAGGRMLCGGVGDYATAAGAPVQIGGIDLLDTRPLRLRRQLPVDLRAPSGRIMTQNPFFLEATVSGLRAYFAPDDDRTAIHVFEVEVRQGQTNGFVGVDAPTGEGA